MSIPTPSPTVVLARIQQPDGLPPELLDTIRMYVQSMGGIYAGDCGSTVALTEVGVCCSFVVGTPAGSPDRKEVLIGELVPGAVVEMKVVVTFSNIGGTWSPTLERPVARYPPAPADSPGAR